MYKRQGQETWTRPPGRPRRTWLNLVQEDANAISLSSLWRTEIFRNHGGRNGPSGLRDDDDDDDCQKREPLLGEPSLWRPIAKLGRYPTAFHQFCRWEMTSVLDTFFNSTRITKFVWNAQSYLRSCFHLYKSYIIWSWSTCEVTCVVSVLVACFLMLILWRVNSKLSLMWLSGRERWTYNIGKVAGLAQKLQRVFHLMDRA